jgi:hypothetical protein
VSIQLLLFLLLLLLQIDLSEAGMRGLAAEARQAALAGWSGKQVIHPKQVPRKSSSSSMRSASSMCSKQSPSLYCSIAEATAAAVCLLADSSGSCKQSWYEL